MLTHFMQCIRTGEPSSSEGAVGRDVLAVVEAATRSASSGRREHVSPSIAVDSNELEHSS